MLAVLEWLIKRKLKRQRFTSRNRLLDDNVDSLSLAKLAAASTSLTTDSRVT